MPVSLAIMVRVKAFDLRGAKKDKIRLWHFLPEICIPYVHRQGGEGDMVVLQPYEYHRTRGGLVRMLKKGG